MKKKLLKFIACLFLGLSLLGFFCSRLSDSLYSVDQPEQQPQQETITTYTVHNTETTVTTTTAEDTTPVEETTTAFRQVSEQEYIDFLMQGACIKKKSSRLVAHAADETKTIYGDTRYTPTTNTSDLSWLADVLEVLMPYVVQAGEDLGTALSESQADEVNSDTTRYGLPALPTYQAIKHIVENANRDQTATLKAQYEFIAKRKVNYPYLNLSETMYLIVYIDENADPFAGDNIFYQDVAIPPNTFTIIRQATTSGGSRQTSYVFSSEYFELNRLSYGQLSFRINPNNSYSSMSAVTPSGTQTFSYNRPIQPFDVPVTNNSYNTIEDNTLIDLWNRYGETWFNIWSGTNRPLTGFECISGLFYNGGYSPDFMERGNGLPWYLSAAYVNSNYDVALQNNLSHGNTYSPEKAPSYIENNNYINEGAQLTTNNVSNYYDYGVSYNNDTGQFEIDYDILATKISTDIIPEFKNTFDLVYENQPEIGFDFNSSLDFDYNKLSSDIIYSLVPAGSGWTPPEYPEIDTQPIVTATVPNYQVYATQTVPSNFITKSGKFVSIGWSFLDTLGLVALIIPLAMVALFWRITGGD